MSTDAQFIVLTTLLVAVVGGIWTMIVYVARGAAKWARIEQRLENLVKQVDRRAEQTDAVHREIVTTIRQDRAATDSRLRWLEETLWTGVAPIREAGRGRPT